MKMYKYSKAPQNPWSVQICPTYGCNRAPLPSKIQPDGSCKGGCEFCGIWSLINKDTGLINFKFMTVETARLIAEQLNNFIAGRRIEINNFGEPLLNKDIWKIIDTLRTYYPSGCIQLQTNGLNAYKSYEEFKQLCDNFFENGGNLLAFDAYEGSYKPYLEFAKRYGEENSIFVCDFIHDNKDNHTYYRNAGSKTKEIYVVDDLGEVNKSKAQRHIFNHAGDVNPAVYEKYGIPTNLPLEKKCSRVFREIVVGFDGTVSICCQSFRRQLVIGNIYDTDLETLWNSEEWNIIRAVTFDKRRDLLRPCDICDYAGGFRIGFLKRPEIEVNNENLNKLVEVQKRYSDKIHFNGYAEIKFLEGDSVKVMSTMEK